MDNHTDYEPQNAEEAMEEWATLVGFDSDMVEGGESWTPVLHHPQDDTPKAALPVDAFVHTVVTYRDENAVAFIEAANEAGYRLHHYRGRWSVEGPAIVVDNINELLDLNYRGSNERIKTDSLAFSTIVYLDCYSINYWTEEEIDRVFAGYREEH